MRFYLRDKHGTGLRHKHAADANDDPRYDEHCIVDGSGLDRRSNYDDDYSDNKCRPAANSIAEYSNNRQSYDRSDGLCCSDQS